MTTRLRPTVAATAVPVSFHLWDRPALGRRGQGQGHGRDAARSRPREVALWRSTHGLQRVGLRRHTAAAFLYDCRILGPSRSNSRTSGLRHDLVLRNAELPCTAALALHGRYKEALCGLHARELGI